MGREIVGTQPPAYPSEAECRYVQGTSMPNMRRRNFVVAMACGGVLYASHRAWGGLPVLATASALRAVMVYFRTPSGVRLLGLGVRAVRATLEWYMHIQNQSDERVEDELTWSVKNQAVAANQIVENRERIALSPRTAKHETFSLPVPGLSSEDCVQGTWWCSGADVTIRSVG